MAHLGDCASFKAIVALCCFFHGRRPLLLIINCPVQSDACFDK